MPPPEGRASDSLRVSKLFAAQHGAALSFCGPTIVVLILFVWSFGLTLGAALIIHPHLGRAIRANSAPTPHDFATAMYAAAGIHPEVDPRRSLSAR
jgi:hypothetical protein